MQPGRWLLALAAAWAGGAAAHAGLVASIPADGAVLAAPPSSVELRFTEPVTPIEVRLFAGSAAPLVLPAPKGASDVVKLALPANLRGGLYTVSFRVISADSHPVGGSIVFGIGERPPPHVAAASDSGLSRATTMLRAVRDLALLIAAGGALFALGIASFPAERSFLAAAGALAVTASAAGIGLQGADIAGASVWSLDAWRAGLFSSVGVSAAVAAAGAVLIAFAAKFSTGSLKSALLLAGALAAIASLPLTGHAMTARPTGVAIAALAAHGLAAAFWIGSLGALLAIMSVPAPGEAAAAALLRRFSRWGVLAVAVLVIAGATFALLQAGGSVGELVRSRYGRLVAAKVVLLLALLLLAILNRFRWLPMLERGARAAARRLRWSIAGEAALAVCVIGVTAVLVQTPPPRAVGPEHGYAQTFTHKEDVVELSVWPAHTGPNAIVLRFRDREGLPFDPEELFVEVGNQAAGVEPAVRPMRRVGPGQYRRDGNELAFPGVWTIDVQARMDASGVATFRSQVPIH